MDVEFNFSHEKNYWWDEDELKFDILFHKSINNFSKYVYIKSLSYLIVLKIKKDKKLNKLFDINIFKHILTKYLF